MGEYYRLPGNVIPNHYNIYLEPDLDACTFKGRVEIDLTVKDRVQELVLNGHNFSDVKVTELIKLGGGATSNTAAETSKKNKDLSKEQPQKTSTEDTKSSVQDQEETVKRKRDEIEDDDVAAFNAVLAKKSKPCPGRYKQSSESEGDEGQPTVSKTPSRSRSGSKSRSPSRNRSSSPAPATTSSQDQPKAEDTKVVPEKKKEETKNDNVQAVSSGLVLMRSEWAGDGESSSEEEDYAQQRFVDDVDEYNDDQSGHESSEVDYMDRVQEEEGGYVLSSDDEEGQTDDVCVVGDDASDDDDVMQVDGFADISDSSDNEAIFAEENVGNIFQIESEDDEPLEISSDRDEEETSDNQEQSDNESDHNEESDNRSDHPEVSDNGSDHNEESDNDGSDNRSDHPEVSDNGSDHHEISDSENREESESENQEESDNENQEDSDNESENNEEDNGIDHHDESDNNGESETEEETQDIDAQRNDESYISESENNEDQDNAACVDGKEKDDVNMEVQVDKKDEEAKEKFMGALNLQLESGESHDANEEIFKNMLEPVNTAFETEIEKEPIIEEDLIIDVTETEFNRDKQIILIHTEQEIVPANYKLVLEFSGVLDDSLRGFYRTKHNVHGEVKWGAACHFEATGARKCFPCIDQPEFRSTFDISVKRPNKQVEVLSNMPEMEEVDQVVKFRRTPPMPTYLICLVIGYYDSITRRSESGVKISVYTQVGQVLQAQYSLDIATRALNFYQSFFGVPYTLPKMDLVAVPDFYIGAMENWGLLTFRETALLYHPQHSTLSRRQYVAILVCHEIAHQWFGNLVSVNWWDQTWLKEGFATWISFLAVDHLFPEFDIWSDFLTSEQLQALRLDAMESSHPIQVEVADPGQIDEIFDEISYSKGASIINMLYYWIGKENFQAGMHHYLTEHGGASAETRDLWQSLDTARHDPHGPSVATVMDDWTTKQGYPTLHVRAEGNKLFVKQTSKYNYKWNVPIKILNNPPIVLGEDEVEVINDVTGFPLVNPGQTSFCRICYDWDSVLSKHLTDICHLKARDKAGILINSFLDFIRSGEDNICHVLELLTQYSGQTDWIVVNALINVLHGVESLVKETKAWTGYLQLSYSILTSILDKVGWNEEGVVGDLSFTQNCVIQLLGHLGHSDTCGEATLIWRREERGGQPVAKSIRPAVYRTVARYGGHREKKYFLDLYRKADRNEEKRTLLSVLASFTNTDIMMEILDWSMSSEVKLQDRVFLISSIAETGLEGRVAAFKFFQDNFARLSKDYTSGSLLTRLVKGVIKEFNTLQDLQSINDFFQNNVISGAQRSIEQCKEDIEMHAKARDKYQAEILEFFEKRSGRTDTNVIRG